MHLRHLHNSMNIPRHKRLAETERMRRNPRQEQPDDHRLFGLSSLVWYIRIRLPLGYAVVDLDDCFDENGNLKPVNQTS